MVVRPGTVAACVGVRLSSGPPKRARDKEIKFEREREREKEREIAATKSASAF